MTSFKLRSVSILSTIWVLFIVFTILSCSDNNMTDQLIDETDKDMELATELVSNYLATRADSYGTTKGRRVKTDDIDAIDVSITVLKFHRGNLVYKTNTDDISGYDLVGETTVTAHVEPGELIFWFAGAGLKSLDSIDFAQEDVSFLGDLPDYLHDFDMWVIQVPEDYDTDHEHLKYDIVYESKENAGIKIRLDPKIQIKSTTVDSETDTETDGE